MTARLSVVLPVYNREAYVAEALRSVLDQTRPPDEIVVVDDGSTDGSIEAVERIGSPLVRIVRQANGGIGAARNLGLEAADGDLVALIDSDDLWEPDKLARQERLLAERPDVSLVFGHVVEFLSPESETELAAAFRTHEEPVPGILATTLLARCQVFHHVGPFRVDVRIGEFIDWFARARDLGFEAVTMAETVARRRVHGNNTVHSSSNADYLRVLRHVIARRRAKAAHGS